MKTIKVEACRNCGHNSAFCDYRIQPWCEKENRKIEDNSAIPDWCPLPNPPDAHEIWAAAQLMPGEGIEDGVRRIEEILEGDEG